MKRRGAKFWTLAVLSAVLLLSVCLVGCAKGSGDTTPPIITLACREEYLASRGSMFTIPAADILVLDDTDETVVPTFGVTVDGADVPVENGTFSIEKEGVYTIDVTATDSAGNSSHAYIKVYTTAEDEINSFDDAVRVRQTRAKGFAQVSLNNDPAFIRDGAGSLRLTLETHSDLGWPGVIVDNLPINDILDFSSVSFWVYNDGKRDVTIYLNRNDAHKKAEFLLPAKLWTKVEVEARDYDSVFQYKEATAWGEPECGTCEDLKCITFHLVNPANSPQTDLYIDSLQVHRTASQDTLELETVITHPVAGKLFEMPVPVVTKGGTAIDAAVSYTLYDADYNEVEIAENAVTLTQTGKYVLIVSAVFEGLERSKSYTLVCASARADDEIDFFEEEVSLNFYRSPYMPLSIDDTEAHEWNGSTASLKIGASSSIWPIVTVGNVPHADLNGVAYIWFWAKNDKVLKEGQKAYIGLRNPETATVIRRMELSDQWQNYSFTAEQLRSWGLKTLEGLQITLEMYDPSDQENNGWVIVDYNTWIDNFGFAPVAEPVRKTGNTVLDFANYRDMDAIDSKYASYNFAQKQFTVNGMGSLAIDSPNTLWPKLVFTGALAAFETAKIDKLMLDVYVPEIEEGGFVRIGANDKNYQKIDKAGEWVTVALPGASLSSAESGGVTTLFPTLEGVTLNFSRSGIISSDASSTGWKAVGTFYIGRIYAQTKKGPDTVFDFETTADAALWEGGDGVTVSHNTDQAYIGFGGGEGSLGLTSSEYSFDVTLGADTPPVAAANIKSLKMSVFVDAALEEGDRLRLTIGSEQVYVGQGRVWTTVEFSHAAITGQTLAGLTMTVERFKGETAERVGTVYLDNVEYTRYTREEKPLAPGVLYDFYDPSEAPLFVHEKTAATHATFEGFDTAKLEMRTSPWGKIYFPADADLTDAKAVYLDIYVKAELGGGDKIRFCYTYLNNGTYSEKFSDFLVMPNQWTTLTVPVTADTELSKVYFYLVKNWVQPDGTTTWSPIGATEGEALFIREVGLCPATTAVRDFVGDFETTADMGMFYTGNKDYFLFRNSDPAYVSQGKYSFAMMTSPKWPAMLFTDAFIAWAQTQDFDTVSFDVYIRSTAGNETTATEGLGGRKNPPNNEWYTITVEKAKLAQGAKLQFNHATVSNRWFYVDNFRVEKAQ